MLGGYTVFRRPEHPAARALLLLGAGLTAYNVFGLLSSGVPDLVAARWSFVIGLGATTGFLSLWAVAGAQLALGFPEPVRVLQRRPWLLAALWTTVVVLTVGVQTVYLVSGQATLGGLDSLYSLNEALLYGLVSLTLAGVARTIWIARRDTATRRQGTLVALGLGTTVMLLLFGNVVLGDDAWPAWFNVMSWVPLPSALAVALVRGEFLDIRSTISRALLYVSLTGGLLGLYAAAVSVIGALAGHSGLVATLPATGVVAVAFSPARARLQHWVDRLLYGERGDPARVLGALGRRLEAALPVDQVLPAIAETVAEVLRLPYVGIKTTAGDAGLLACERGEPPDQPECVPLLHQGRAVGELLVGPRRGERSLSDGDRALLGDIARHVAASVSAASLHTEIAASRSRLAVAREEERARLRHDLHDRLGSHLVGLTLQLDTLETRSEGTSAAALREAHLQAESALDEVRRLSRGLRPAELDELGLVAAINAAAGRLSVRDGEGAWHASVTAAVQLPIVTDATEAAAYHITVEALTNAYRHSGGEHAHVRIGVDAPGSSLNIEVTDDGRGINGHDGEGVGLRSMRSRAAQVGGVVWISERSGGGTVVRTELPLCGQLNDEQGGPAR